MANSARGSGSVGLSNSPSVGNDDPLEDHNESEFNGATLSITSEDDQNELTAPSTTLITSTPEPDANANLKNENTRKEMASTKYERSYSQSADNDETSRDYFAVRSGAFENAVKNCQPIILENIDGIFRAAWLLTEIDHWDNEKERIVFLLDKSIIIIKYDFITLKILDYRRIHLQELDQVNYGQITYPEKSLMPKLNGAVGQIKDFVATRLRHNSAQTASQTQTSGLESRPKNAVGVRAMWNKGQPIEFSKSWNPWSRQIPFITFTAHRLHYTEGIDAGIKIYDIEDFKQRFLQCIQSLTEAQHCIIKEEPILIENYVGLVSAVHNFTDLGFFKARGRVSF